MYILATRMLRVPVVLAAIVGVATATGIVVEIVRAMVSG